MRAFRMCGCLSAFILTGFLLTRARGDADSEDKLEIKYVLIGVGLGLLFTALFIAVKVCIIRQHVQDNYTDGSTKRPSEPHLFTLSHLSQSDNPAAAAASNDAQG